MSVMYQGFLSQNHSNYSSQFLMDQESSLRSPLTMSPLSAGPEFLDCLIFNKLARKSNEACHKQYQQLPDHGRSKSESTAAASTASSRYKTEMCRPFEETGHCRYGSKCQFAHGVHELRSLNRHPKYKTELCRTFHSTGFCSYGQRCNFIHNDDERQAPATSLPVDMSRPRALSLAGAMGSAGDSPASSVSGDSPSSSPGFLNDDVFSSSRSCFFQPPYVGQSQGKEGTNNLLSKVMDPSMCDVGLSDDLSFVTSLGTQSRPDSFSYGNVCELTQGLQLPLFSRLSVSD